MVFNPNVPDPRDPNWLSYSKGISTPEPDKSTAIAIKSIGDLFSEGIKAADTMVERHVEDEVYKAATKAQDTETAALDITYDQLKQGAFKKPGEPPQSGEPLDILNTDPTKVPQAIKDLPAKVDRLENARANGKLPETLFLGQLVKIGKEYNSRFPGYTDVVKRALSKATGIANVDHAYLQSRLADINSYLTSAKSETDKMEAYFKQHSDDTPGLMDLYAPWKNKEIGDLEVMKFVNTFHGRKAQLALKALERTEKEGGRKDATADALTDLTGEGYNIANAALSSLQITLGQGTSQKVTDYLRKWANGELPPPDAKTAEALGPLVASSYQSAYDQIFKHATETKRMIKVENGKAVYSDKTIAQELGDNLDGHIKKILEPMKVVQDLVNNRDYGRATEAARTIKAIQNSDLLYLYNKGDALTRALRLAHAFKESGGDPFTMEMMKRSILELPNLGEDIREHLKQSAQMWMLQPGLKETGKPATVIDTIAELESKKLLNATSERAIWDLVDLAVSPDVNINPSMRDGVLRAIFTSEGQRVLNRYAVDGVDPKTGDKVTGRYHIFRRLTSVDMVNAVWASKDPEMKKRYLDWIGNAFTNDVLGKDLQDLSRFSKVPGVNVFFNTENKIPFFQITMPRGMGIFPDTADQQALKNFVTRINSALEPLSYIYEKTGADAATSLLEMMQKTGVDIKDIRGLPNTILQSIISNKKQEEEGKQKGEEQKKRWQQSPSDKQSNFAPKEDKLQPAQQAIEEAVKVRRPKQATEGIISYGEWEDVKPNEFYEDAQGNKYIMRGGQFYRATPSNAR